MIVPASLRRAVKLAPYTLLALACAREPVPPTPAGRAYPSVDELPEQPELPDLFASFFDDKRAATADDFRTWRRAEINDVLAHYAYGPAPDIALASVTRDADLTDVGEGVDAHELTVDIGARALHVAVFIAPDAADAPAVLGPNKCGNQSLVADPRVRVTDAFALPACGEPGERGTQTELWPVAQIVAAGFALVTYHESEVSPDDVDASAGGAGPSLSAWARANSIVLDALLGDDPVGSGLLGDALGIDPSRVAVFGHSRRGKAALLTAARDERFAAVVAHQSGTMGASVLRNDLGESLLLITGVYPHWFNDELPQFVGGFEDRLPFDQHHLIALTAPRPLLLVDGDADDWADPQGALAAARAADAAWELLGDDGLVDDGAGPRTDATLVWQTRPGDHSVTPADWTLFLAFLSRHLNE